MSAGLNSMGIIDAIMTQIVGNLASQSTRTGCGVDGGRDSSTVLNHSLKILFKRTFQFSSSALIFLKILTTKSTCKEPKLNDEP